MIIKVNPEFCSLFGSEYETHFYKIPIDEIVDEDSKAGLEHFLNDYTSSDYESNITFIKSDSSKFKARISKLYSSSEFSFSVIIFKDFNEKEKQEIDTRDLIKSHFNNIGPYFWTGNLVGSKIELDFIDREFLKKIGYESDDIQPTSGFWENIIHPADKIIKNNHVKTLMSGQSAAVEYRILSKKGEVCWLLDHGYPLIDSSSNSVLKIYGAVQDITQRKQALAALKESEENT